MCYLLVGVFVGQLQFHVWKKTSKYRQNSRKKIKFWQFLVNLMNV